MSANQVCMLRPALPEEVTLFYSQDEKDADFGTVGHLRIDFGHEGEEFWSTWWPHNDDELNTPEFKAELQKLVDELRKSGPLNGLSAMSSYCCEHGDGRLNDGSRASYGYVVESERYRYCLRCTPIRGDYNAYLYIYDKRQQGINRLQTARKSAQNLPEICFSTLPSDGSLICIRHGETGYFKSDWDTGDPVKNREIADYNNKKLGVSKVQEEAMVSKSMTGWAPRDPGFGQTMG